MKIETGLLASRLEASDHPNEMRFEGVLLRLDEPSSKPPNGSRGHRILISTDVAKKMLPTLIGMGINYDAKRLASHAPRHKVGVIQKAWIKGHDLWVSGVIWKRDFPEAESDLKKSGLGMSFEASDIHVADVSADVWKLTKFYFTGATILNKTDAAYYKTSAIAANAAKNFKITIGGKLVMAKRVEQRKVATRTRVAKERDEGSGIEASIAALAASQAENNKILGLIATGIANQQALLTELIAGEDHEEEEEKKVRAAKKKARHEEDEEDDDEDDVEAAKKKGRHEEDEDEEEDDDEDDEGDMESAGDDDEEGDLEEMGEESDDDDDDPGHLNQSSKNKGDKTKVSTDGDENKNLNIAVTGSTARLAAAVRKLKARNRRIAAELKASQKANARLANKLESSLEAAAENTDRRSYAVTPSMLTNLLSKEGIDVNEMRASGAKMSVADFDQLLNNPQIGLSPKQRIALKNDAVRAGVMDEGFVTMQQ